jgi:hypothetical protein
MRTSHTARRRPRRLLAIKAPGECLTLPVVQKLHGDNDCLVFLIVFEFVGSYPLQSSHSRMAAIAAENPAAGSRTVTVRINCLPELYLADN